MGQGLNQIAHAAKYLNRWNIQHIILPASRRFVQNSKDEKEKETPPGFGGLPTSIMWSLSHYFLLTKDEGIFKGMWAPWRADWPRKEIEVKLCRHQWSMITSMIIIALRLWWSHYDNQWSVMITSMIISSITQTENLHWEPILTVLPPTFSERLTIQVNIKTCLLINNIVNTCQDIFTMNSFENGRWCLRRTSTGWWWGGWIKMTRF